MSDASSPRTSWQRYPLGKSVLDPNDRASFVEMLRPPPGYDVAGGLGTAFSLHPDVLTAALLALIGADAEDDTGVDPVAAVRAMRRLAGRVRIVVQRGRIAAERGRVPERLVALFDRVVRDVGAPGITFHPKVWVLKFDPRRTPEMRGAVPLYRVLCTSRNITDSRSWEVAVRFEGLAGRRTTDAGRSVRAFCERVLRVDHLIPVGLEGLLAEIEHVQFEDSRESSEELAFLWQCPEEPGLIRDLPKRGRRALLVTPFAGAPLVRDLQNRFEQFWVVGTQAELDALPADCLGPSTTGRVFVVGNVEDSGTAGFDLHAKVLLVDGPEGSRSYFGSANGTSAAWGQGSRKNWEALVKLRPGIGIDRFLKAFVLRSDGALHPWIERYTRTAAEQPDELEEALDGVQRATAGLVLEMDYNLQGRRLCVRSVGRPPEGLLAHPRLLIELAPLLLQQREGAFRPLTAFSGRGTVYEPVELGDVSDFMILRVTDSRRRTSERRFMILARSNIADETRETRDDLLCADLLRGVDVRTLLWAILWGPGVSPRGARGGSHGRSGDRGRDVLSEATIEGVIEACTEDPARIEEIDALLRSVELDGLGSGFRVFWANFKRAASSVPGPERVS